MNEFLLIFRRDFTSKEEQPSPEQLQASIKPWQDWFGSIAALQVKSGDKFDIKMVRNGGFTAVINSL